jgi:RNA polymerase sigma-70 factor (ECF subfamily)
VKYRELDDLDLLALVGAGRAEALEALYSRYAGRVYSLALGLLRDPGFAEEVTEEVFLSLWRRSATYDSQRSRFTTWLLSIAHHRAVDRLRQRRATPFLEPEEALERVADPAPDPLETASRNLEGEQAHRALETLPPEQREVLVLAYFRGYTQSEIARRLKIPLGTVKTRMRLGLKKLRETLVQEGMGEDDM